MKTKKFNLTCTVVALIGWLLYLAGTIHSAFFAFLFSGAAVGLGIACELFVTYKKTPDKTKLDKKHILHYVLTFLSLLVVFYAFGTFANPSFGYYSFGSGEYGYNISFWGIGEIIPDLAYNMGHNFLPILLVVFAVYCKPLAFCTAGVVGWINILILNTAKMFGSYVTVAARGNETGRETIVYGYANNVVTAIWMLMIGLFIIAVIHTILSKPKAATGLYVVIGLMIIGLFCSCMSYASYSRNKIFNTGAIKSEIYNTAKEGSYRWQEENFKNEYGTINTPCAYPGCERTIVTSGDSNCCSVHSNRCLECDQYIDGDAIYCMDCIEDALK